MKKNNITKKNIIVSSPFEENKNKIGRYDVKKKMIEMNFWIMGYKLLLIF
jgi:hypothetical protein